jgi:hypothetical protein
LSLLVNQYDPQGNRTTSQSSKTCQLSLEVLHPQTVDAVRNVLSRQECQAWIHYAHSDTHSRMEKTHPIQHHERSPIENGSRWQRNDWNCMLQTGSFNASKQPSPDKS